MAEYRYETDLFSPLVEFLQKAGRIRDTTIALREFPWNGRKVDFVTLTRSRRTTAYELKLTHNSAAIEQAIKNSYAFDRSYVVTATVPGPDLLDFANRYGVGVLHISKDKVRTVLGPSDSSVEKSVRARLLRGMKEKGELVYVR